MKTTMSASDWRPGQLAGDDLLQLVHLEPVEHAALDGLDQVARLELRLLARVAADERRPFEHDVVELPRLRAVRAHGAHERAVAQPLATENGVAGPRRRDDDVLLRRVAMALSRLGARLRAERVQLLGCAAVGDNALDRRHGRPDRADLRLGLPAAADDAEAAGAGPREVLRGNAARGPRAPLAERVRLDHRCKRPGLQLEEADDELRLPGDGGVGLHACVAQLAVDGGHHRERTVVELESPPRHVLDRARGHPQEARLDHRHRIARRDQALDVALGEIERQARSLRAGLRSIADDDAAAIGADHVLPGNHVARP